MVEGKDAALWSAVTPCPDGGGASSPTATAAPRPLRPEESPAGVRSRVGVLMPILMRLDATHRCLNHPCRGVFGAPLCHGNRFPERIPAARPPSSAIEIRAGDELQPIMSR
jgi:hypothetical protein